MTSPGTVSRALGWNAYRFAFSKPDWLDELNITYSPARLDGLLTQLVEMLGARVISRSAATYNPRGASAAMLIAQDLPGHNPVDAPLAGAFAHLEESHVAVHTYPDAHPASEVTCFRLECDVSTCGHITPEVCIPHLWQFCKPDLALVDFRVSGLARTAAGKLVLPADLQPGPGAGYNLVALAQGYALVNANLPEALMDEIKGLFPFLV